MLIFLVGGSTPDPPTLLVNRVVLLHMLYGVSNPLIPQLYLLWFYDRSTIQKVRIIWNLPTTMMAFFCEKAHLKGAKIQNYSNYTIVQQYTNGGFECDH